MNNKELTEEQKKFLKEVFKRTMDEYSEAVIKLQHA
jgi:hypothetical protein